MRYLGGKSRFARDIANQIQPRGKWWDAFCGGLSVSVEFAKFGPGIASDVNRALISLYTSVQNGWQPPLSASDEDWRLAKTLEDADPRKAFFGFGCSYGGMWFRSPTTKRTKRWIAKQNYFADDDPVGACARSLLRDIPKLKECEFLRADFLTCDIPDVEVVYCDPEYEGTTGYDGVGKFDHASFWSRTRQLAEKMRVFVSEYRTPPIPHVEVWNKASGSMLARTSSGLDPRAEKRKDARTERLFRILAPGER